MSLNINMKIDYEKDTYGYFSGLNRDIVSGKLLDYGCNYGTFLDSSRGQFNPCNYVGIDVDQPALADGQIQFPDATFIHSNYYNSMYNPHGEPQRPVLPGPFQTIISYSVLTHTSIEDFYDTVDWLYGQLIPGGRLMVTWLDVDDLTTNNFFYNKRRREFGRCDPITTDSWTYLVNNRLTHQLPHDTLYLLLFFKREYLLQQLSDRYQRVSLVPSPRTKNCFQSCLIIERT
jgi:2-polyprenyl-3-methyl-5-hydroxy-6-metoxy-1,4-benzoquinol methylase